MKAKDATGDWDKFLGKEQTSVGRGSTGPSTDRIWSESGDRSIRFGDHEMSSTKLHYHKETWSTFHVENVYQGIYAISVFARRRNDDACFSGSVGQVSILTMAPIQACGHLSVSRLVTGLTESGR